MKRSRRWHHLSHGSFTILPGVLLLESDEATAQVLFYLHDGGIIIELPAVVRGREHCHQFSLCVELVALLDNLVSATYQVNIVLVAELFYDLLIELVAHASIVVRPAWHIPHSAHSHVIASRLLLVFIGRVRPKQVAHEAVVRHVAGPSYPCVYVAQVLLRQVRTEAAMHAQNSFIDQGRYRHVIKHIGETAPQRWVVPPFDFIEEAVNTGDCLRLVVSTQQEEMVGELNFPSEKQTD